MKNTNIVIGVGVVLVGLGIYLYATKKTSNPIVNLNPPMVVEEENKVETTIFTALDKLKELIKEIKSKRVTTTP